MYARRDDAAGRHRAWRIVFGLAHVGFLLVNGAALVSAAMNRRETGEGLWGAARVDAFSIQFMSSIEVLGRLAFIVVGVYLLAMLARRERRAVPCYVGYGVAFLVFEGILRAQYILTGFWFETLAYAALIVAGLVFLAGSPQMRAALTRESPPTRAVDVLLGLGATALIVWPFLAALFIDPNHLLAGIVAPMPATDGQGAMNAIFAGSVSLGLVILTKFVWRWKTWLMAGIVPVTFVFLAGVYWMLGFALHFEF